jgi:hypothetical protein
MVSIECQIVMYCRYFYTWEKILTSTGSEADGNPARQAAVAESSGVESPLEASEDRRRLPGACIDEENHQGAKGHNGIKY